MSRLTRGKRRFVRGFVPVAEADLIGAAACEASKSEAGAGAVESMGVAAPEVEVDLGPLLRENMRRYLPGVVWDCGGGVSSAADGEAEAVEDCVAAAGVPAMD